MQAVSAVSSLMIRSPPTNVKSCSSNSLIVIHNQHQITTKAAITYSLCQRGVCTLTNHNDAASSCKRRIRSRYFSSISTNNTNTYDVENNNDAPTSSAEVSLRQAHWESMFDALKSYKAKHGDSLVPATYPDNPKLGNFVDNSRQLYRLKLEAKDTTDSRRYDVMMSDERIERLNSIGFVWNLYEHSWNKRYEELKEYVAKHGNCLVPWNYHKNVQLGMWVTKQRRNYQVRKQDENNAKPNDYEVVLTDDRIQKLDELEFVWEVHEVNWFERYEELKIYVRNHGDALVPKMYSQNDILLGRWVDKQRLDYKRYLRRKEQEETWKGREILDDEINKEMKRVQISGMSEKRLHLLEKVGFVWDVPQYLWEMKFEEMRTFVAANGHAIIRERRGGKYDPLARWAAVQRRNYKKQQNGENTTLTEERIRKLDSIGFVWDMPRSRKGTKVNSQTQKESIATFV